MVACSSLGHGGLGGVLYSERGILITSEGLRVCIPAMDNPVNTGEEKESNPKLWTFCNCKEPDQRSSQTTYKRTSLEKESFLMLSYAHPATQTLGPLLVPMAAEQARTRKCGIAQGSHPDDQVQQWPHAMGHWRTVLHTSVFQFVVENNFPWTVLNIVSESPTLPSITEKEALGIHQLTDTMKPSFMLDLSKMKPPQAFLSLKSTKPFGVLKCISKFSVFNSPQLFVTKQFLATELRLHCNYKC